MSYYESFKIQYRYKRMQVYKIIPVLQVFFKENNKKYEKQKEA